MIKQKLKQLVWLVPFASFALGYIFLSYTFQSKTIKTPHFIGSSLHEAMTHASASNLRLQIITEKEHSHIEPGTILEQKPQSGSAIKEKQSVYIITSRAPQQKNCPVILNRTVDDIKTICEKKRIKQKSYYIPSATTEGLSIAQIPEANKPLKEHKIISYIAEKQSPFFILPDFRGLELNKVIEFLRDQDIDFSVYHKTTKMNGPYPRDAIISNQKPLIGSFVKLDKSTHIQLQIHY